jgi:hypothetical protein
MHVRVGGRPQDRDDATVTQTAEFVAERTTRHLFRIGPEHIFERRLKLGVVQRSATSL